MLPTARQVNGKKVSGRLWASYRGLEVRADIGIGQWRQYGVFGETFSASHWWGEKKQRARLTLEELTRLKPCQVLTRSVLAKKRDTSQNFFSLPVDMAADGDVEEFCNIHCQSIKRVWSTYQGLQGETWLLWCRLGAEKNTVTIRQCVVEDKHGQLAPFSSRGRPRQGPMKPDIALEGVNIVMAKSPDGTMGTPVEPGYIIAIPFKVF